MPSQSKAADGSKASTIDKQDKWREQMHHGDITEVTKHFSKHWNCIEPKQTMKVLSDVTKMLAKFQDNSKKINAEMIIDLILLFGRALGLEGQTSKCSSDSLSNILYCINYAIYICFNQGKFTTLCQLCNMIVEVSKKVYNLPENKLQPELIRIEQIAKILWRTAVQLGKNKNSLGVFCNSLEVLSVLRSPSIFKDICTLSESLISHLGLETSKLNLQGRFLQTVFKNVHFKRQTPITSEEKIKADQLLMRILKHLFKEALQLGVPQVKAELQTVIKMKGDFFCAQTFDAAMTAYEALTTFIADTRNTDVIKKCRSYLVNDDAGKFAASVLLVMSKMALSDKIYYLVLPLDMVREVQSLLLACIPLTSFEDQFAIANLIVRLAERELPSTTQTDKWEDGGRVGISIACDAIRAISTAVKKIDEEQFQSIDNIFQYITFLAYKFSLSEAMCYHDSQMLYEVYQKHVYLLIPCFLTNRELLTKLLTSLALSTKNASFVLCVAGGKDGEKRFEKAILSTLLFLAAVVQSKQCLDEDDFNARLQTAVKIWQEMSQKLSTVHPGKQIKNIVEYWQLYKKILASRLNTTLAEPDWETILVQEIYSYPEDLNCRELVQLAANGLENLKSKSTDKLQAAKITIALAYAKNRETGDDGPAASQAMCTTVITNLSGEKDKSAELLVLLMQAYFQQYISYQKDQRKQGKKLAEMPLTTRAPPMKVGPGGESQAIEAWEEAEELSQLGKELSCRQEARNTYPLTNLLSNAMLLERKLHESDISSTNRKLLEPALNVLESVCYMCGTMGQYWMALKACGLLFSIARSLQCPQTQLLAVSMMASRYSIQKGSKEEQWLKENVSLLRDKFSKGKEDKKLILCELYLARCYFISDRMSESAEIVLSVLNNVDITTSENRELVVRAYMLASQLLVALPSSDNNWKQLFELVLGPSEAAEWASVNSQRNPFLENPPERNSNELRRQELIIETLLWAGCLGTWTGSNRSACISLHYLIKRVQLLMLPTRVAQVLSCLGDLDLLTPDKNQLEQRLFWNQKILSLGSAIEGSKTPKTPKRTHTVGTSPTRFSTKQYQLTAYCSERCMKVEKNKGCNLCKYPLYHICKAHYAILVEGNEQTFMRLNQQLQITWKENASRLWDLTWGSVIGEKNKEEPSVQGWLPMLLDPITLLECRVMLSSAAVQAGKGAPREALETLNKLVMTTLKGLKHEIAPVMLCWAKAQVVACQMQIRGLGGFSSKLKCQLPLSTPTSARGLLIVDENKSPRKALTPKQTPAVVVAPRRPGRKATKTAAVNVPPVPLPAVPKFLLTEHIETISPRTKEKILFTLDNSPTQTPSARKKKGKENVELPIPDGPTFVLPSTKGPRSKKITKVDTAKKTNLGAFPVFEDNSTPAKKMFNATPSSITKSTTKSNATPHHLSSSTKKISKPFEWSPKITESPSKFVTPRGSARVYSSASISKKKLECATTTKRPLAKKELVIISSSDDSPIAPKSTVKNRAVINRKLLISSSVKRPVNPTSLSPSSSNSTDSPIIPPKSCNRVKKAVIESSSDSSPDSIKRQIKVNPSIAKYNSKQPVHKQESSSGSVSPIINKAKGKSKLIVDSSSEESSPTFKKSEKQNKITETCSSMKTKKVINTVPSTSKANYNKSVKATSKTTETTNKSTSNSIDATLPTIVIDSDTSLIESSICEEKPKRAQTLKRNAHK